VNVEGIYDPAYDRPLDTDPLLATTGTAVNYRVVRLQRLANPLLAWNANSNPYVTIDTASVDMTAFNGVADESILNPPLPVRNVRFGANQRGTYGSTPPPTRIPCQLTSATYGSTKPIRHR